MNIFDFLSSKLTRRSSTVTLDQLNASQADKTQYDLLRKFGVVKSDLSTALEAADMVNFERQTLYAAIDRSLCHPLMASTPSIFADTASNYNRVMNATVWGTVKNREYEYQLNKFLEIINIEENIYDWCWTVATYGDLFVEIHGEPGVGIVSVSDDEHPLNISRVDYNGRLVGFYSTPGGYNATAERKLRTPWDFVHFRLLGSKRRRPQYQADGASYSEYRTVSIMAPDVRRLTSKYGTSVLADALPIYKRLRLVEDSIMMARITRGVLRYLYKIGLDPNMPPEAVSSLIDNYVATLKEARNFNIDLNNPSFGARFNAMNTMEDLIIPVFGEVNSVAIEKLGGEVDIKWLEDVDMLTKQLSTALKVPLPLLAGYAEVANGGIGQNSLEKLDIRFARQARRIQRAIIVGLTRMFQIHLAWQGINPDLDFFQIHMSETSTAEELELQEALDKGIDTSNKVMDLLEKVLGVDFDKEEALKYLNDKYLKLTDLDLSKLKLKPNSQAFTPDDQFSDIAPTSSSYDNPFKANMEQSMPQGEETPEAEAPLGEEEPQQETPKEEEEIFKENKVVSSDLKSMLPINEAQWKEQWGDKVVKIKG